VIESIEFKLDEFKINKDNVEKYLNQEIIIDNHAMHDDALDL